MANFYEVLGVMPDAEHETIVGAYSALAKKYHPDVNPDIGASDRIKLINEAFDTLGDRQKRAVYDELLRGRPERSAQLDPVEQAASSAIQQKDTKTPRKSGRGLGGLASDALYIVVGVPILWLLSLIVAHILLLWGISVAATWMSGEHLTWGGVGQELVSTAVRFIQAIRTDSPQDNAESLSLLAIALCAGIMYVCSSAASVAVISHSLEERSHLPIWLVYLPMLLGFGFLCYRNFSRIEPTAPMLLYVGKGAMLAAILAGIVSSRHSLEPSSHQAQG